LVGYFGVVAKFSAYWNLEKRFCMHEFLIALVFVAMVAAPAIVASSPKTATSEDQ